jgi:hypothetical protein
MRAVTRCVRASLLLVSLAASGPALSAGSADEVTWIADSHGCKVANTFPRPGESITWSGKCKDGFADGDGVLQWFFKGQEDDRFEGHLAMGWAEGRGALAKADGGRYVGDWKHSVQEGSGRYDAPDGSWYQGQWKDGKPNGQGEYRAADGRKFVGEWVDGVFQSGSPEDEDQDEAPDPNRT